MDVREKIFRAYRRVVARDAHLLTIDANERSITHRFAIYIEHEFPEFNVDCEYNRKGVDVKRLPSFGIDPRTVGQGVNLYPDIIVHHRGTDNNLVAVEAKPSSKNKDCQKQTQGQCSCDRCKLRAYKADLGYVYAFYAVFPIGAQLEKLTDAKLDGYIQEIQ